MKFKNYVLAALALSVMGSFTARAEIERTWVDNFGKVWRLAARPCLDNNAAFCIIGTRDRENTLKCGPLPVQGTEVISATRRNVITLTVFPNRNDCIASTWAAVYDPVARRFNGYVINALGVQTPFVLDTTRTEGSPVVAPNDPSKPRP